MSRFWSRGLGGITAYQAGEQPQDRSYIKLNTNENPYPPSPRVMERLRRAGMYLSDRVMSLALRKVGE